MEGADEAKAGAKGKGVSGNLGGGGGSDKLTGVEDEETSEAGEEPTICSVPGVRVEVLPALERNEEFVLRWRSRCGGLLLLALLLSSCFEIDLGEGSGRMRRCSFSDRCWARDGGRHGSEGSVAGGS